MADIAIKDEGGTPTGVTISIGPAPSETLPDDENGVKTLASRITGWSKFVIDGETYSYSKARALALLSRFPDIAKQLSSAKDDASAKATPAKTETKL